MKKRIAILLTLAMVLSPMTPLAPSFITPVTVFADATSAAALVLEAKGLQEELLPGTALTLYFRVNDLNSPIKDLENAIKKDEDIADAEAALQVAMGAFKDENSRKPLADAIEKAKKAYGNTPKAHAPAFAEALNKVIETAEKRLSANNIANAADSVDALDDAVDALADAIEPYGNLLKAIAEAEKISIADYTTAQTRDFKNALAAAIRSRDFTGNTTNANADYETITTALNNAKDALADIIEAVVDKSALTEALEKFELVDDKINPASYTNYAGSLKTAADKAVKDAQDVKENPFATKADVDTAVEALDEALEKLIAKADLMDGYEKKTEETLKGLDGVAYANYDVPLYYNPGLDRLATELEESEPKLANLQKFDNALVSKVPLATATVAAKVVVKAAEDNEDFELAAEEFFYLGKLEDMIETAEGILTQTENVGAALPGNTISKLETAIDEFEKAKELYEKLADLVATATEALKAEPKPLTTKEFDKALKAAQSAIDNADKTKITKYGTCITDLTAALEDLAPAPAAEDEEAVLVLARDHMANENSYYAAPGMTKLKEVVAEVEAAKTTAERERAIGKLQARIDALVSNEEMEEKLKEAEEIMKLKDASPFYMSALNKAYNSAQATFVSTGNVTATKNDNEIGKLEAAIQNFNDAKETYDDLLELIGDVKDSGIKTTALTRATNAAERALSQNLEKMTEQLSALAAAFEEAGGEIEEKDDEDNNKDDDDNKDDDNNNGSVNFNEVGMLGTSRRLVLEGDTDGITVVIVKVSGSKETYTYSTATTVILPKGATCYAVNLGVDEIKAKVTGTSFAEVFAGNIQATAIN